jgi:hypothetical protein
MSRNTVIALICHSHKVSDFNYRNNVWNILVSGGQTVKSEIVCVGSSLWYVLVSKGARDIWGSLGDSVSSICVCLNELHTPAAILSP